MGHNSGEERAMAMVVNRKDPSRDRTSENPEPNQQPNQESITQDFGEIHGDWMVATHRKHNLKVKSKGRDQGVPKTMDRDHGRRRKVELMNIHSLKPHAERRGGHVNNSQVMQNGPGATNHPIGRYPLSSLWSTKK